MQNENRPPSPELVRPEPPTPKRGGSLLTAFIAGFLLLAAGGALAFLMLPVAGVVMATGGVVALLFGAALFHYVVWGWWLSGVIREQVEEEEPQAPRRTSRVQITIAANAFAAGQRRQRRIRIIDAREIRAAAESRPEMNGNKRKWERSVATVFLTSRFLFPFIRVHFRPFLRLAASCRLAT